MTKAHCVICNRDFRDQEALEMHNKAKHTAPEKKSVFSSINKKKVKNWGIALVISIAVIALIVWMVSAAMNNSKTCTTEPVTEINIGGHTNLALHIHQQLQIIIDGIQQPIPANIGVYSGILRPLHTHDASGEIHVEGKCRRDFTLGEFFQVWGMTFNSQCIFDKCTDSGTLTKTVNGQPSDANENLVLRDGQNIVIEYTSH